MEKLYFKFGDTVVKAAQSTAKLVESDGECRLLIDYEPATNPEINAILLRKSLSLLTHEMSRLENLYWNDRPAFDALHKECTRPSQDSMKFENPAP